MIGFVFVSETEAKALWKKVNTKKDTKNRASIMIDASLTSCLSSGQLNDNPRRNEKEAREGKSINR
jgi:hypothetical protein